MGSKSRVRIDQGKLRQLTRAKITALEKTAEALHTEIVQTQVMPRDTGALQMRAHLLTIASLPKAVVQ